MPGCAEWEEAFMIYDPESTGSISSKDCTEACRALGCNPAEWEVQDLMAKLAGGGGVTYGTFCQIMTELDDGGSTLTDLVGAFKQFDRDGAGTLPGGELKYILQNMGEVMTTAEVDEFMRQGGFRDDTMINYTDFAGKVMAGASGSEGGSGGGKKKKGIAKGKDRRSMRFK